MKSVMTHQFSQAPMAQFPRSQFDRNHGIKTTGDAGFLIPILVDEALPGDTFNVRATLFGRLATPLHPFMDNLRLDTFFFAIPYRQVWNNWQKFNGEQEDPGDSTDFIIPEMTSPAGGYAIGSLSDYFGIPTGIENLTHSSLWHRAYNLVYNEWFRDQNLQDSVVVDKGDGPDDPANYPLLRRGKRHDYFTSALPWPQKGPAVDLPIAQVGMTLGIGKGDQTYTAGPHTVYEPGQSASTTFASASKLDAASGGGISEIVWIEEDPNNPGFPWIRPDVSGGTSVTINQLRESIQIQKMYEKDARGGTRYIEIIRAHFGVISPDARLQRPEYLGGSTTAVNVNPIAQTSASDTQPTPQGNLAAIGTINSSGHGFTKSFVEHCLIIGLVCLRADLNYQQGLNRMFSRSTRFDFFWPSFAHLGEQTILNKEIFAQGNATDEEVFGYQERYAEYRYKPSMITGKFRSSDPQTLDAWHLAQDFATLPALNATFIEENPPIDRVLAVTDEPDFILDGYFQMRTARPMPVYSIPGMMDRF